MTFHTSVVNIPAKTRYILHHYTSRTGKGVFTFFDATYLALGTAYATPMRVTEALMAADMLHKIEHISVRQVYRLTKGHMGYPSPEDTFPGVVRKLYKQTVTKGKQLCSGQ